MLSDRRKGFEDAVRALDTTPYDDDLALAGIDGKQFAIVCMYLRERLTARGNEDDIPTLPDLADLDDVDECTCLSIPGALCPVCHKGCGR